MNHKTYSLQIFIQFLIPKQEENELCEDCQIDYEDLDKEHEEFIQVMDGIDPGLLQKTDKGPSIKDVDTFFPFFNSHLPGRYFFLLLSVGKFQGFPKNSKKILKNSQRILKKIAKILKISNFLHRTYTGGVIFQKNDFSIFKPH